MRFRAFQWDEENIFHIARHNITPEEVEEACFNNPLVLKWRKKSYCVYSQTDNGRYIMVIIQAKWIGVARVITARDMTKNERQKYKKR